MKQYYITQNDAEQRLDKFLKKLFPTASRDFIYKLHRTDKVKVLLQDGKKTKQDFEYKLQVNQIVQVYLPDTEIETIIQKIETQKISQVQKLKKSDIIFEDESLLFVNKSA